MGIRDNGGGIGGGGSGGGSGAGENGDVWGGLIVEGDGSVGSVIASLVVHIVGFYFIVPVFFLPLTYLHLARRRLQTSFSKEKKSNPVVGGIYNEPVLYELVLSGTAQLN